MINNEYFIYQLLDDTNVYIRDLQNIESASISYSCSSKLKLSGTIKMWLKTNETLNTNHRIRVIHCLNGKRNTIATFLIATPSHNIFRQYTDIDVECYSVLWLHEADKITTRTSLTKGTNVVNEVKRLLGQSNVSIPSSQLCTSVDLEWEIGTSKLDICNDLLSSINYTQLYPLPQGLISSNPYILPQDRVVDLIYDDFDNENKIEENCVSELDFFNTPNVFVRYVNNPQAVDLVAVYENVNPDSPTSVVNRPRNVDSKEIKDAADMQTLFNIAKKDCSVATNKYHTVKFKTSINHNHGFETCLYLSLNNITGKFIEQEWDMECVTGGTMNHYIRRVVEV